MTRFLTDEALHDAELAHQRLVAKLPEASLMVAVQHYLEHHAVNITEIPATQAIDDFLEERRLRKNRVNTVGLSGTILKQFIREARVVTTADFIREKAENWIRAPEIAARTQRDRYDLLVNFAKFLTSKRHLAQWPLKDVMRPRAHPDTQIAYLTVEQCQELLNAAAGHIYRGRRGALLPYFTLCLFSGLRPDEARRIGVEKGEGAVTLENRVAHGFMSKTGAPRSVELQSPLLEILACCQKAGIAPGVWSRRAFEQIQVKAGLKVLPRDKKEPGTTAWDNDILRHTYASHHFALHGDMGFLVINMGNSESVLKTSYINRGVLRADAERFFQLQPAWAKIGELGSVPRNEVS